MKQRRGRYALSTTLSIGALAGLLIWTKLRLVSDLPRSAYAVPHVIDDEGEPDAEAPEKPENPVSIDEPVDAVLSD